MQLIQLVFYPLDHFSIEDGRRMMAAKSLKLDNTNENIERLAT